MTTRRLTGSLFLVALLAGVLSACGPEGTPPPRDTLDVSGTGEVKATPDRFRVRAVSSRTGSDINAMKQEVDAEIGAAIKLADELGIADNLVRAMGLSVQPEWQWQPERKLIGHRVTRDIDFAVDGVEIYAELLEALTRLGFTELHQAGAELADPASLEEQALRQAVDDARRKADILAQAAGRTLGAAIAIQEQGSSMPQPVMMAMDAAVQRESSAYAAGELTVRQQVQVRFLLE
ncbi:SIMPL domain-containing protein [Alcanivorax quisquiliarum]|uniref:SIMPL domain-containing protein n=1 Tax=Alcanivorax quisquiliarum TaxID=2933565 RepID=A0ABT0E761_9GAMM|nr:SIMPL domain-containing protein [Alcanivorax quisquiliarum]MCK0537573.1 SIMPL domain-containing protein [Alcanivorax quisquiliarum]